MAATFQWSESNGAGEVVTDGISNLNFGSIDSANIVPVTYPIVAGQNSFEKFIRGKFAGTFTSISNLKFWKSSGAYVTDEDIKAAINIGYATPTSSASAIATITVPVTEGGALAVTPDPISAPGYTNYIVLQMQIGLTAPAGSVNQKTFSLKYDET